MYNISEIYDSIIAEKTNFGDYFYRRLDLSSKSDLFFGITRDMKSFFLFEYSEKEKSLVDKIKNCEGFTIEKSIKDGSKDIYRCRIISANLNLNSLFNSFVEDICESVKDDQYTISDLINRIILWIGFFRRTKDGVLSFKEQLGLFGELSLILEFINRGYFHIIDEWIGPNGGAKDFIIKDSAIEVKTLLSDDKNEIQVSNLNQLDNSGLRKLFLNTIIVYQDNMNGYSIADLVYLINYRLNSIPELQKIFNDKLLKIGYSNHFSKYYEIHFIISYNQVFLVSKGFPCIISKDILPGIHNVKYSIDLSQCNNYITDNKELFELC